MNLLLKFNRRFSHINTIYFPELYVLNVLISEELWGVCICTQIMILSTSAYRRGKVILTCIWDGQSIAVFLATIKNSNNKSLYLKRREASECLSGLIIVSRRRRGARPFYCYGNEGSIPVRQRLTGQTLTTPPPPSHRTNKIHNTSQLNTTSLTYTRHFYFIHLVN